MRRRFFPIVGLIGCIGSGVLPCHLGPLPAAAQSTSPVQEIRVTLTEWSLIPAQINVPAGRTIRFLAHNAGFLPHALAVSGPDIPAESPTAGSGDTVRLDVIFSRPGTYEVYCPVNAGEHRVLGQEGVLRVLGETSSLALPRTGLPDVSDGEEISALPPDPAGEILALD